jgi:hypothetical protein
MVEFSRRATVRVTLATRQSIAAEKVAITLHVMSEAV